MEGESFDTGHVFFCIYIYIYLYTTRCIYPLDPRNQVTKDLAADFKAAKEAAEHELQLAKQEMEHLPPQTVE